MVRKEQLDAMRKTEITKVAPASLADIDTVAIDASLPAEQRMERYLEQVKNPYCFRCEDTPVKVRFVSSEKTLEQKLGNYFIGLKG
ncbi:MAG: hypothetical protein LUG13_03060 [Oscillospiraceae bacterium]|nr:hypothetical protein [Oscillospiraceae bacterium]